MAPGFVVICPFAGGTFEKLDKTWPQFPQFTRELLATGRQVVACPGPGEETVLREHYPGVMALEGVKLGAYGAILRRAALLVSNDTGPGHLAAAVGAPRDQRAGADQARAVGAVGADGAHRAIAATARRDRVADGARR